MIAWLMQGAHPCAPQTARAEVFVPAASTIPTEDTLVQPHHQNLAILGGAHLTAVLVQGRTAIDGSGDVLPTAVGAYFLASIGEVTLRVDDLRAAEHAGKPGLVSPVWCAIIP